MLLKPKILLIILLMLTGFQPVFALYQTEADSLERVIETQPDSIKTAIFQRLSYYYLEQKNPQRSLKKGLRALEITGLNKNSLPHLLTLICLREAYMALFLHDDALKICVEIEQLSTNLKRNDLKIRNYLKTANIYRINRDFPPAEKNYRLAIITLQIKPLVTSAASLKSEVLLGLAACLRNQNRFEEAMTTNQQGLQIAKTIPNDTLLSFFYNNIGDLHEIAGRLDSAYFCYQTSMNYNLKTNDVEGLYFSYSNLSSIEKVRGNYDKAIELLKESVKLAEKNKNFEYLYNNYLHLFGTYSAKRDHKTALHYLLLLEQTGIPQAESDTALYVAKVESRFELDKKQKENEIITLRQAQEKSRYLVIIMAILVITIISSAIYYFKYKQKKINELMLKEGKARAELDALQARINPHFLFNSLNSLGTLIAKDPKNADQMLNNLSRLLRYTLQTAKKNLVTLQEEMGTVQNYLQIEKIRFEERLSYQIECSVCHQHYLIPPLIIQPLVENSIKYAVGRMVKGGHIDISCVVENQRLKIKVKDNGPPLDTPLPTSKSTGFGMKYIKERLQIMYGSDYSFVIDRNNGYTVTLDIPAETVHA